MIDTANYVYHKVICTGDCLNRYFMDPDPCNDGVSYDPPYISFNKLLSVSSVKEAHERYGSYVYYGFGAAWCERENGLWEIKFATRWKYPIHAIVRAIELNHDLIWYAVEENHVYISRFYWSDGVKEDVLYIEYEYDQWSQKNPDFVFSLADYDDTAWYFLPTATCVWRNWESTDGFARYMNIEAVFAENPTFISSC